MLQVRWYFHETMSNSITYPHINILKFGAGNESLHDTLHEWPMIMSNIGNMRKVPLGLKTSLNSLHHSYRQQSLRTLSKRFVSRSESK